MVGNSSRSTRARTVAGRGGHRRGGRGRVAGGGSGSGRHSATRRGPAKQTMRQWGTRSTATRGGSSGGH
jgi:hypothetical protein